ncbi:MAG: invasion associated locus B family protein [Hyphomicrobiaceae bacterium]
MKTTHTTALAVIAMAWVALSSAASAQQTRQINEFRDWTVYHHGAGAPEMCFAASQPKETSPRDVARGQSFFYVTSWPQDGVKAEVSMKLGFTVSAGTDVEVQIGNARFQLFGDGDSAFVKDVREELRLIEAMKRGSFMVVIARNERGTEVRDTYSLLGVTQAINAIQPCS